MKASSTSNTMPRRSARIGKREQDRRVPQRRAWSEAQRALYSRFHETSTTSATPSRRYDGRHVVPSGQPLSQTFEHADQQSWFAQPDNGTYSTPFSSIPYDDSQTRADDSQHQSYPYPSTPSNGHAGMQAWPDTGSSQGRTHQIRYVNDSGYQSSPALPDNLTSPQDFRSAYRHDRPLFGNNFQGNAPPSDFNPFDQVNDALQQSSAHRSMNSFADENQGYENNYGASSGPSYQASYVNESARASTVPPSSQGGSQYVCEHFGCHKGFDTRSERAHHARCHDPPERKPLGCELCDARFHYKKDLTRHEKSKKHQRQLAATGQSVAEASNSQQLLHCENPNCTYYQDEGFARRDHFERHKTTCRSRG